MKFGKYSLAKNKGLTIDAYTAFTTSDTLTTAPDSWKSSNKKVARIDSEGKITIVGKGSTWITATFGNVKVKAKIKVTR